MNLASDRNQDDLSQSPILTENNRVHSTVSVGYLI
jgi:hypothetical protein